MFSLIYEQTALIDELHFDSYHNNHFVIITNATPYQQHSQRNEGATFFTVCAVTIVPLAYGQEPTNRPSNGK